MIIVAAENQVTGRYKSQQMMAQYKQIIVLRHLFSEGGCFSVNTEREREGVVLPSSPSSRTSAQLYPSAKSGRFASEGSSDGGFWSNAEARVDFPEEGWPRIKTCLAGVDLD